MSNPIDQEWVLANIPRYKDVDNAHKFLPRYKRVAELLSKHKYDQHELEIIMKWIESIESHADQG